MKEFIENQAEQTTKEIALVSSLIIHNDILGGTPFQTFDKAYLIAKNFVKKYGLDNSQWTEKDFEEAVIEYAEKAIAVQKIEVDVNNVVILCPYCDHSEEHPIHEQRHHIQNFELSWLPDMVDMNEISVMKCHECKNKFNLEWDYDNKKPNEPDVIGSFDKNGDTI